MQTGSTHLHLHTGHAVSIILVDVCCAVLFNRRVTFVCLHFWVAAVFDFDPVLVFSALSHAYWLDQLLIV